MNDILIENKLALHFVDFFTEKEPLKRWKYYYDKEIRCVFIYPTYNIEIYKNIIAYHFGKVQKIFARKCEVRILKAKDIKPFFEQNNIEGYRQADKAYCLFYNNELMMAYSVGHAFFGKGKYDLEIARGACKMGYQIVGGASRLWKAIINDNPLVQTIVYYVDRREYDGRSMKFLNNVDTSYFGGESFMNYWVKENRYANREPARNAEIVAGYHDGSIIQVKNPGSWTNIYKVEPNRCYVYKVTNKKTGKYYIGSKTTLNADNYYIGYNYFTSSTDTEFVEDFKKNTTKYKHEVLKYFTDKQQCLDYEADLIEDAWENDRDNLINKGFVRKNGTTHHVVSIDTPEIKARRIKAFKETWANKSEEERKEIAAKRGVASKIAKESFSDEKKAEMKRRISESLKIYAQHHQMDSSKRKHLSEILKKRNSFRTQEDFDKISKGLKEYYTKGEGHTAESYKVAAEKRKQFFKEHPERFCKGERMSKLVKEAKAEMSRAFKDREDKSITWNQFQKMWKESHK